MALTIIDLDSGAFVLPVLQVGQTVSDATFDAIAASLGCSAPWRVAAGSRIAAGTDGGFFQHFEGTDMFRWEAGEDVRGEALAPLNIDAEAGLELVNAFVATHLEGNGVDVASWWTAAPTFLHTKVAEFDGPGAEIVFEHALGHLEFEQRIRLQEAYVSVIGARLCFTISRDRDGTPRVIRCFRYFRAPVDSPAYSALEALSPSLRRASQRRAAPAVRRRLTLRPRGADPFLAQPAEVKADVRAALSIRFPSGDVRARVESVSPAYFQAPPFVRQTQLLPVWEVRGVATGVNQALKLSWESQPFRVRVVPSRVSSLTDTTFKEVFSAGNLLLPLRGA